MRRSLAFSAEIIFISALILVTRCANYGDVFFGGQINFVDADCYARMTRARICFEHPGAVVRRHDFENFPIGTSPHTTAPLDYLIVVIATALKPVTNNAFDLAGAVVSPLLSVALGIFLCWWTRQMEIRFRWALLILYALSPMLAHGFALGRPDHQSLLITLITLALCAEWTLAYSSDVDPDGQRRDTPFRQAQGPEPVEGLPRVQDAWKRVPSHTPLKAWSIVSCVSWSLALWVSLYEPMLLLVIVMAFRARALFIRERRIGWIVFAAILALAFMVERRIPQWPSGEFAGVLKNWSSTIGELSHVSLGDPIWFGWCGWLLLLAPTLLWPGRKQSAPRFLIALLVATFALTMWQARWSYFFVMIFAMVLPEILSMFRKPLFAISVFIIAFLPVARAWDRAFSDEELARGAGNKIEQVELRALSSRIDGPFIAPWWFSPALSYWSGQAGVGGSSHESIEGTVATSKFFATQNAKEAAELIDRLNVKWVVDYDADRLAENSSRILGHQLPQDALCYLLDRHASAAPPFLRLISQTGHFKLFRVVKS